MSTEIMQITSTASEPNALEALARQFDKLEIKYLKTEKLLEVGFPAYPLQARCSIRRNGKQWLLLQVRLGFFVPEPARTGVQIMMNRKNWETIQGCFEMDEEDGEVAVRYSYPLIADSLDGERAAGAVLQLVRSTIDFVPDLLQATAMFLAPPTVSDSDASTIH